MIIIEDTREQDALPFKSKSVDMVVRHKLDYGDYSAHSGGIVCPYFFERKGIGDLFGTLGKGHGRFKKEVARCNDDGNKLIVIVEAPYKDIMKGYRHSKMKGIAMLRTLFTLQVKYGVQFVCCSNRSEMTSYIVEHFLTWERNL